MVNKNKDYVPILKTKKEVGEEAKRTIQKERTGKQLGLRTRFGGLNIAFGKYFRFGHVTLIAGPSGHGKSALLNMILDDFTNTALNGNFKEDFIIVHDSFEMKPVDEVLRTVSSKAERSHLNLLSAEWNGEHQKFNQIDDIEYANITGIIDRIEENNHYYFDEPTNIYGLHMNIHTAVKFYKAKKYAENPAMYPEGEDSVPNPQVVMALDHTLLVEEDKGDNTLNTIAKLSKLFIHLKKRGYMVIAVGQFNNTIESPERIKNPMLHYPIKSDIYAQAQLYHACDEVLTISQPELLGILEYGKNKYLTHLLVHLQVIKQRFGKVGSIWLQNQFHRGQLVEFTPQKKQ